MGPASTAAVGLAGPILEGYRRASVGTINSEDTQEIIHFCRLLEPTLGGINLEDIKAPKCRRRGRWC